jgi:centromere protein I
LLAHIPIDSFQDTYIDYFQRVEQVLAPQGPFAYQELIGFYTNLLQQQVRVASSQTPQRGSSDDQVFIDLTAHVATITTSLLVSLSQNEGQTLVSAILSFYEMLSISSIPHVVPIILPPMHLVYLLTQHASPTTLSRVCGIIGSYKLAFDQHPKPVKDYYPTHVTDALNWCLRDIYHLLWISRALVTVDQKARGLYCDPALRSALNDYLGGIDREYAVGAAFGLSNNACLASMSAVVWRAAEEQEIGRESYDKTSIRYHQGPVSQRSLEVLKRKGGVSVDWDGANGFKVMVLNWLAERGMGGLRELMFATVTELRGKS